MLACPPRPRLLQARLDARQRELTMEKERKKQQEIIAKLEKMSTEQDPGTPGSYRSQSSDTGSRVHFPRDASEEQVQTLIKVLHSKERELERLHKELHSHLISNTLHEQLSLFYTPGKALTARGKVQRFKGKQGQSIGKFIKFFMRECRSANIQQQKFHNELACVPIVLL